MVPLAASIAVVCTVAICCWPSALRTISNPLDRGAYRKLRGTSPGLSASIMPTSDFSGFESSDCALASAAAKPAIDSLDRCMGGLRLEDVEADRPVLRAAGTAPVTGRPLRIFRNQGLKLSPDALVLGVGAPSAQKDARELGP